MRFVFTTNGRKTLERLDQTIRTRILKKLAYWEKTPQPLRYAEKVEGFNLFKYRVGDFRVIVSMEKKEGLIKVKRVGHRSQVYQSLDQIF